MPLQLNDPGKRLAELRRKTAETKKRLREMEAEEREAQRPSLLFREEQENRPCLGSSWIRLAVGAIRPLKSEDSLANASGLVCNLVAGRSDYVVDYPTDVPTGVWLEPETRVEFVSSGRNQLVGHRLVNSDGNVRWNFVAQLTSEVFDIIQEFARDVDTCDIPWTSPHATLMIYAEHLEPLPPLNPRDISFFGPIASLKVGDNG
ncbi:MAG: hypothetical protein U0795_00045 [Pirellulales bacterium]